MVLGKSGDAHKHREGVQQKENEDPGERRAVPVADRGEEEEQIGQRVPDEDADEVLVVVPAHGVVDEWAVCCLWCGEEYKCELIVTMRSNEKMQYCYNIPL